MNTLSEFKDIRIDIKSQIPRSAPDSYGLTYAFSSFVFLIISELFLSYSISCEWYIIIFAVLFLAVSLLRFQFLLHESSHGVLVKNRYLNDMLGRIAGCLVGYKFETYRVNHSIHHRFVGSDKDTELDNFINLRISASARKQMIMKLAKSLLCIDAFKLIKSILLSKNAGGYSYYLVGVAISAVSQIFILSIFTKNINILYVLIIYVFTICSIVFFLNRIRAICEHELIDGDKRFEYSKTHISNIFTKFLISPLNFNYHFEHHVFPEVSSYYYPIISCKLQEQLKSNNWVRNGFFGTLNEYWKKNYV